MRITFVAMNYTPEPSGTAPYTAAVAEHLAGSHEVTVLAGVPHYPQWRRQKGYGAFRKVQLINRVQVKRYNHYVPKKPTIITRICAELSFLAQTTFARYNKPRVVVVVTPSLFSLIPAALHAKLNRARLVVILQDVYHAGLESYATGGASLAKTVKSFEVKILGLADQIITIHSRFGELANKALNNRPGAVSIIANWAREELSAHIGNKTVLEVDSRIEQSVLSAVPIVVHAGAMGDKQDIDGIIKAAQIMSDSQRDCLFVFAGGGSKLDSVKKHADSMKNVVVLGPLANEEYASLLSHSSVALISEVAGASTACLPSKLNTYFNFSLPVVASTDVDGAVSQTISENGAGIVVEPEEPKLLAKAIEELISSEGLIETMGSSGHFWVQENAGQKAALDSYEVAITEQVMQKSSSNA